MMNIAGEAQTLASSLTHSAFNISNALGAAGRFRYRFGRKLDLYGVGRAAFSLLALLLMFISVRITDGSKS
jgi:DHA1 family inner membrane transport protein